MTYFGLRMKMFKAFEPFPKKTLCKSRREKFVTLEKLLMYMYLNYKATQNDRVFHTYEFTQNDTFCFEKENFENI